MCYFYEDELFVDINPKHLRVMESDCKARFPQHWEIAFNAMKMAYLLGRNQGRLDTLKVTGEIMSGISDQIMKPE